MNLFDPNRPRSPTGEPLFCPNGEPLNVMPSWYVRPLEEGGFKLEAFFSIARNIARPYTIVVATAAEVHALMTSWVEDPEELAKQLGWERIPEGVRGRSTPRTASVDINLDDLDLEL